MASVDALRVECYSGYRGEETPRRFEEGERRVEVTHVLDRWLAPDHRYFKCRGSDESVYILRYDVDGDCWELTLFASGAGPRDWGVTDRRRH